VGVFLAKISRGRTLRQFILATLVLPSLYSFFWLGVYGAAGIRMENTAQNRGSICNFAGTNLNETTCFTGTAVPTAADPTQYECVPRTGQVLLSCRGTTDMFFDVIESYGGRQVADFFSVWSLIALVLYFITSSDSGSYVIDIIAANGMEEPPVLQRVFWAICEGACACALLAAGGSQTLGNLQTVSICMGLPYTFVLFWMCSALLQVCREEVKEIGPFVERRQFKVFSLAAISQDPRGENMGIFTQTLLAIFVPQIALEKAGAVAYPDTEPGNMLLKFLRIFGSWFCFYGWIVCHILAAEGPKSAPVAMIGWSFYLYWAFGHGMIRQKLRARSGIEGNLFWDFLWVTFAYPCVAVQMAEQSAEAEYVEPVKVESAKSD
jgi:hypothetical protein